MKSGEPYWNSAQKRTFDLLLVAPMQPALLAARLALGASGEQTASVGTFMQQRVGRGHDLNRLFTIYKLPTLDDSGQPLNWLAGKYRKLGVDELAQTVNIRRGDMSVCGHRPLVAASNQEGVTSYEEVMDNLPPHLGKRWSRMTQRRRPGILSTYALQQHTAITVEPNHHEMRAEMDMKDANEDSLASNVCLLRQFAQLAIERRLQ